MKVIGIDPALRNTGLIRGNILENELTVNRAITYKTKPRNKEISHLNDGEHDTYCAMYLYESVSREIDLYKPELIGVEIGSGAQSQKAAAALGAMKGFIGGLMANYKDITWIVVDPYQAKRVVEPKAKKEMIQAWVLKNHPEYDWDKIKNRFEHQADATIVMHAAWAKYKLKR